MYETGEISEVLKSVQKSYGEQATKSIKDIDHTAVTNHHRSASNIQIAEESKLEGTKDN
jgi:hypothetical protein